jgi:AraC-like DNA-binding protein
MIIQAGLKHNPPGVTKGPETKDTYELCHVFSGKGKYRLGGSKFDINSGDVILVYPGTIAEYCADAKDPWILDYITFKGADAGVLMDAAGFSPENPVRHPGNPEKLKRLMLMISEAKGEAMHELVLMVSYFYTLVSFLIEDLVLDKYDAFSNRGQDYIKLACEYIAANYAHQITISNIASHVNLSRSHLYRIFMENLRVSPKQYLIDFRIREACTKLQQKHEAIKNIASEVGFDCPMYFSTVFKQITGKTPSDYALGCRSAKNPQNLI